MLAPAIGARPTTGLTLGVNGNMAFCEARSRRTGCSASSPTPTRAPFGSVESGAKLFETYAPAGGVGLRVLLNKRSRTNLTTDWGWGKAGSSGFYLGIQEAF